MCFRLRYLMLERVMPCSRLCTLEEGRLVGACLGGEVYALPLGR